MEETVKEEIKEAAKTEGLELAEDVTIEAIQHVFNFARTALTKSGIAWLIALVPILTPVEEYLLSAADKIDGKDG